jgi:hypothetical protein
MVTIELMKLISINLVLMQEHYMKQENFMKIKESAEIEDLFN